MEDDVLSSWKEEEKALWGQANEDLDYETALSFYSQFDDEVKENTSVGTKGEVFFEGIDKDLDYAFALSLQSQYEEEVKDDADINSLKLSGSVNKNLSIVDEQWEFIDPHPDIHALFIEYDNKFFYGKLKGVEVRWSPRMTLCAGVCSYEGRGGLCSIRLSVPLLKLRPRRDLVETLIHEMIHAYLFVTNNNKDRDGHGPEFLSHMNRINRETGTRITVYHSFHDEVDLYRQHWWKCNGPCKSRRPFYGLVKRAMNRAPGPNDNWWAMHQSTCGGNFVKIKEPDNYGKKKTTKRKNPPSASESKRSSSDIRSFLKSDNSAGDCSENSTLNSKVMKSATRTSVISSLQNEGNVVSVNSEMPKKKPYIPFQGTGQKLGGSSEANSGSSSSFLLNKFNFLKAESTRSSNSSRETSDVTSLSKNSKFPRLSDFNKIMPPIKVQQSSKPSSSKFAKKNAAQSPMEKFLSFGSNSHTQRNMSGMKNPELKKNDMKNLELKKNDISEVPCPVCSTLVMEQEINSHLDTCLNLAYLNTSNE